MILIEIVYVISAALLALYGYNALVLSWLRVRLPKQPPVKEVGNDYDWPAVTIQLPVYNERYVVQRLIEAVGNLDYPADSLQIQVLDDSSDDTYDITARAVYRLQKKGVDIVHITRQDRVGFKGGALQNGLSNAKGEFIAIFDADFLPDPDFLKRTVPYFADNDRTGCIQTRWGHLNPETSWLTKAQASGIDGHFLIEQETRSSHGLLINFNGTGGVWRKTCILDAGGWHHDTLTEDLDLSYRAQLNGWQIRYIPQVTVPAELPAHINAYKRQQFRWAKGSLQTAKKLLGCLWRSPQPTVNKIQGTIHLTNYAVHPLILINLILTLPMLLVNNKLLWIIPFFLPAAFGPWLMYWIALAVQGVRFKTRLTYLAVLVLVGVGLSVNNTRAAAEAVLGIKSSFLRTPKFNLTRTNPQTKLANKYLLPNDVVVWIELILAVYATGILILAIWLGIWSVAFWLLMYAAGFSYIVYLSINQSRHLKKMGKSPLDELAVQSDQ